MAVYTQLDIKQVDKLLAGFNFGKVQYINGIREGIENSNYYVTTERADEFTNTNNFVLTIFERTQPENLEFFIPWLRYLHSAKISVAVPILDKSSQGIFNINSKPAILMSRLIGVKVLSPNNVHCRLIGQLLAKIHKASRHWFNKYNGKISNNPRDINWWKMAIEELLPHVESHDYALIQETAEFLIPRLTSDEVCKNLDSGPVHADIFRDNVLFSEQQNQISGIFDFFFGGKDFYLYDLAITINDWCAYRSAELQSDLYEAMIDGYESEQKLPEYEKTKLPLMLLGGAFRFYLSRLHDVYFPRAGMVDAHDPKRFRDMVEDRIKLFLKA